MASSPIEFLLFVKIPFYFAVNLNNSMYNLAMQMLLSKSNTVLINIISFLMKIDFLNWTKCFLMEMITFLNNITILELFFWECKLFLIKVKFSSQIVISKLCFFLKSCLFSLLKGKLYKSLISLRQASMSLRIIIFY